VSNTTSTSLTESAKGQGLITRSGWLWIAALGTLFVLFHQTFFLRMSRIATGQWSGDWSHALIVPLISAYFIFQNRAELTRAARRVYWPGLVLMILSLGGFAFWIYGRNTMLQGYCMIVGLFSIVLFLLGPRIMRFLWFPIFYLAIGVQVAPRWWDALAAKLQYIAAQAATIVLQLLGNILSLNAEVRGTTIELEFLKDGTWQTAPMNVAEACAGLRMLMAFVALGLAMAYLSSRQWWQRLTMILLTVPVAILVNVSRVAVLGVLYTINPELAQRDPHIMVGMLMLIPAGLIFLLIGWILDQIVIDEDGTQDRSSTPPPPVRPKIHHDPYRAAKIGKGLFAGAILAALIGTSGGLVMASIRPDLFGETLIATRATVFAISAFVLLIIVAWLTYRAIRPETVPGTSRNVALGVTAGVLLVAVLGLDGVVWATQTVLIKEKIPLREQLYRVGNNVGIWEALPLQEQDPPLSPELLQALGTDDYLSKWYRDRTKPKNTPGSLLKLHVAYYTGKPDGVAHVPERCFTAGGLQFFAKETAQITLNTTRFRQEEDGWIAPSHLNPHVHIPRVKFPATVFTFAHPGGPDNLSNVVYFFVANGKFLTSPDHVRLYAFDPRDKYGYYCKVEVLLPRVADSQLAMERVSSFLSDILPEILACLPDWVDVTEGRYPNSEG